jgi:hypothetical protein
MGEPGGSVYALWHRRPIGFEPEGFSTKRVLKISQALRALRINHTALG